MLAGVGLVSLAGAITACGAGDSSSSAPAANAPTTPAPAAGGATSSGSAAGALATTSEIPVGGGMIFPAKLVVVTQPTSGDFKAFSAVCTPWAARSHHQQTGTIDRPCHGSQYSIKNGAVVGCPAPAPLPAKQIKANGSSIFLQ